MDVARRYTSQLERIKKIVKRSYDGFLHNYDTYNKFMRFVFESSLQMEEISLLMSLSRPQLEFNVLEAYISRLLGEFSKQEPEIEVTADDESKADPLTIKILEAHLRHLSNDNDNNHLKYLVYKDLLAGGFSAIKVVTEYANPMSFQQVIRLKRVSDPTLCGWDILAKEPHKGDGNYCFELVPMSKDDFMELYPKIPLEDLNFRRNFSGYNWAYLNDTEEGLLICDYYEKKKKEITIVMLNDGKVMEKEKYNKMIKEWNDFMPPPAIVGRPRTTTVDKIERYRLIENKIIEHEETDFTMLPIVFVDGNSALIKTPKNGNVRQVTRPYVYHAKSAQRLKNYAGISLANEIENIVQHKFIIKKEALPKEEEFLQAIKDVQKPSNIIVNAFYEEDPDKPIHEPIIPVPKVNAPPEISSAFSGTDAVIQNILGSYDAALGINNNQLSGIAIVEAATQSNAAAMPYIVGFLHGYQRAIQIYVDLLPKYYKLPITIPIKDEEGKKSFVKINSQDGVNMFYDSNTLNVVLKAGASFAVQKARTIMMIKEMMGMSPLFQQFIGEKGLMFLLDNMEGKGIEQLKSMVQEFVQGIEQEKQMKMQQMQSEMQNNPALIKAKTDQAKIMLDAQKHQSQLAVDMAKLKQDEMKVMADLQTNREKNLIQTLKSNTERFAKMVDLEIKKTDISHKHRMDHYDRLTR